MEKQNPELLLRSGASIQITVPTNSMHPFIRPNRDAAVIAPLPEPETLKRGDVALYRREGSILVLHRVWKVKNGQLYMVGDNQTVIEGPLEPRQFCGKLACIHRGKREIPVSNPIYWAFSRLWLFLRPLRPIVWKLHRLFRRGR